MNKESIQDLLLQEHSKRMTIKIARQIRLECRKLPQLMKCYFSDDLLLSQRAAWVVGTLAAENPEIFAEHLDKILSLIKKKSGIHQAVLRNGIKLFERGEIPLKLRGKAANIFFELVSDASNPIAVRAYALTALSKICRDEPELSRELSLVMDSVENNASAGLKSRIRRTRKELNLKPGNFH